MYQFISIGQFQFMAKRFEYGIVNNCWSCTYDKNNIWIE